MRIKVSVTKDDIKHGLIGDSRYCPIARAIKSATFGKIYVSVTHSFIYLGGTSTVMVKSTKKINNFIRAFDVIGDAKPFTFTITLNKSQAQTLGITNANS